MQDLGMQTFVSVHASEGVISMENTFLCFLTASTTGKHPLLFKVCNASPIANKQCLGPCSLFYVFLPFVHFSSLKTSQFENSFHGQAIQTPLWMLYRIQNTAADNVLIEITLSRRSDKQSHFPATSF